MVNTSLVLEAIAQYIAQYDYQPLGYPDGISINIVPTHPKAAQDFTGKKGVIVLNDVSSSPPNGYDRLTKIQGQLTAWAIDAGNAREISDAMAGVLQTVNCHTVCMRGQGFAGNLIIDSIGGTSYSDRNNLHYRTVRFSGIIST
jgi:hypothetical protein